NTLAGTLTMGAVSESATTEPGTVGWTYQVSNAATQYLEPKNTRTNSSNLAISYGDIGVNNEQLVTVTITGTNHAPTITVAGIVAGNDAGAMHNHDTTDPTPSAPASFALNSPAPSATLFPYTTVFRSNTLAGTLTMGAVSESATTEPGTVGWTYQVSNAATQY